MRLKKLVWSSELSLSNLSNSFICSLFRSHQTTSKQLRSPCHMQTWRIYQIIHTVPQQNTILIHLVHSCPILKRLTLNRTCNSNAPNCTILHIIRVPYVLIILYTYITSWSIVSIVLECYIIYDYKIIIYNICMLYHTEGMSKIRPCWSLQLPSLSKLQSVASLQVFNK